MPRSRLIYVLVVAIVGLAARAGPGATVPGEYRSKAEKLALLDKAQVEWSKVNRWLIEYEAVPSNAKLGLLGAHRIMAVAAPGSLFHMGASFTAAHPWQQDPFCQEYFVHDGVTCHRWPFNRSNSNGRLKKGAVIPGSLPRELLLTIIPSWPLADYRLADDAAPGARITPPEAVRSEDYSLLSGSEEVAGWDCAVFEYQGKDRIWVATGMGFCVIKREGRNPTSGQLLYRTLAYKVEELSPGLWLPIEFQYELFSVGGPTNHEAVEADYRVRIVSCALGNAVPETTFIPAQPPGTLEYGPDGRFSQTVPGGEDLLGAIARFAAGSSGSAPFFAFGNGPGWKYLRPLIAFGTGICLGICLVRVRKRQTRMQSPSSSVVSAGANPPAPTLKQL